MRAVFKTAKNDGRLNIPKYMQKFIEYLKDTRAEMKHVSWPTKDQTVSYTILVIILSVTVALFLGAFDAAFRKLLEIVLK